jgi:tRNA pseudouridine55 synthase
VSKPARRTLSGVLLLDKPAGITSNAAVGWAKRLFNAAKAGHTGTLDPFATGLLPVCFGEAAKFARFQLDADKRYLATLKLGERSSSGDVEGEIVERRHVDTDASTIDAVLASFVGARKQMPPMHSAVKVGGTPLYRLARRGLEVERTARDICVHALAREAFDPPLLVLDATVSKGTYIRTLAEDIGATLGCGAHLVALRRTATGHLLISGARTLEQIESIPANARDALLLPCDTLAAALPAATLDRTCSKALANGQTPPCDFPAVGRGPTRMYSSCGRFLGVARAELRDQTPVWIAERLMGIDSAELAETP